MYIEHLAKASLERLVTEANRSEHRQVVTTAIEREAGTLAFPSSAGRGRGRGMRKKERGRGKRQGAAAAGRLRRRGRRRLCGSGLRTAR